MESNGSWKYCVAGNILKTRIDEHLEYRNGTAAFKGGAKVYLNGKYHSFDSDTIDVIGLTHGHRFQVISVPVQLIEHVRIQRVFKPKVLEIMNNPEFRDTWWHDTDKDRDDAALFVAEWNKYMNSLG